MNLLEEAIIYSTILYQGKIRKINNSPFILHPLEVAQILSSMTNDIEIIASGVLHDIVEDTDGTIREIEKRFGDRVALLVDSETEKAYPGENRASSWRKRKEMSLEKLRNSTDIGVKMLWLADKLSNLRSLAASYGEYGEKVWDFLNQKDPESHLWYYRTVAEYVEMDLNKTGSYKEYIDRINYIWPGTFDSSKAKYKEYRTISVEGCECIGKGAKSDIYRYNDELIVKVYNEKNTYKDVEREINLARTAFVMGLPTAISFGIVSVGKGYGSMFELIDAKTLSELIAKNSGHTDHYAGIMAELARQIHSTSAEDNKLFPNADKLMKDWVTRAYGDDDASPVKQKLIALLDALPPAVNLIHGDLHTGNVFLTGGEPLFIDVDRMSVGSPIADISAMYLFYVGYAQADPQLIEDYMGFSADTARAFYYSFLRQYLKTDDEAVIAAVTRKASLLAYVRFVGQIKRKKELSDSDAAVIGKLFGLIEELSDLPDLLI